MLTPSPIPDPITQLCVHIATTEKSFHHELFEGDLIKCFDESRHLANLSIQLAHALDEWQPREDGAAWSTHDAHAFALETARIAVAVDTHQCTTTDPQVVVKPRCQHTPEIKRCQAIAKDFGLDFCDREGRRAAASLCFDSHIESCSQLSAAQWRQFADEIKLWNLRWKDGAAFYITEYQRKAESDDLQQQKLSAADAEAKPLDDADGPQFTTPQSAVALLSQEAFEAEYGDLLQVG